MAIMTWKHKTMMLMCNYAYFPPTPLTHPWHHSIAWKHVPMYLLNQFNANYLMVFFCSHGFSEGSSDVRWTRSMSHTQTYMPLASLLSSIVITSASCAVPLKTSSAHASEASGSIYAHCPTVAVALATAALICICIKWSIKKTYQIKSILWRTGLNFVWTPLLMFHLEWVLILISRH